MVIKRMTEVQDDNLNRTPLAPADAKKNIRKSVEAVNFYFLSDRGFISAELKPNFHHE